MANIVDENFLRNLYTKERFSEIYTYLKDEIKKRFPQWSDLLPSNFGVVLLEIFAGLCDYMRFMQNVTAVEAFPATARLRESLFRHAKWFGYLPKPAGAARVTLEFTLDDPLQGAVIPLGTQVSTEDGSVVFETTEAAEASPGTEKISVGAVHAHLIRDEVVGTSDGSANQRFQLANSPLVVLSTTGDSDELPAVRVWVNGQEWQQVRSFAWASELGGAEDEVFKVEIEADDTAYIVFGDGTFGAIPPNGAQIVAEYWVGGGPEGNVGANTLTKLVGNLTNIRSVTNPEPATGGHEAESVEELRKNIPSQVVTRGRAVTRNDYKRLLEAFGEVASVNIYHPQDNIVEIYVLPEGGGLPSDELKSKLAQYLDNIRMITEDVRICDPSLVAVDVAIKVWVSSGTDTAQVATKVYEVIRDNLSIPEFARQLYPSDIYALVMNKVSQVIKADLDKLAREGEEGVEAIICAPDEIIVPGSITVNTIIYDK